MSRMQKTPLLALVAILALIGLCLVGVAEEGNALNLPNALPDGSTLVSVRDVFTEVADEATAQQLRAHMPHVLGGTEYRYVLEENGSVEAEWGIVVFEFESEQIALEDFQYLAGEVAFVNKNPRFVRIEGAEDVAEIQAFLNSDLENACLMNEIVIFPEGKHVVWVDDYRLAVRADEDTVCDRAYRASISKGAGIADLVHSPTTIRSQAQQSPWSIRILENEIQKEARGEVKGVLRIPFEYNLPSGIISIDDQIMGHGYLVSVDGNTILDTHTGWNEKARPPVVVRGLFNQEKLVLYNNKRRGECWKNFVDLVYPETLEGTGKEEFYFSSHLFDNGEHEITLAVYCGRDNSGNSTYCEDTIQLHFENDYIAKDIHPDSGFKTWEIGFDLLANYGVQDEALEILRALDQNAGDKKVRIDTGAAAEYQFAGDKWICKEHLPLEEAEEAFKVLQIVDMAGTVCSVFTLPAAATAKEAVKKALIMAAEYVVKSAIKDLTHVYVRDLLRDQGINYKVFPGGDLEGINGNRRLLLLHFYEEQEAINAVWSLDDEDWGYRAGVVTWDHVVPMYLDKGSGEWQFLFLKLKNTDEEGERVGFTSAVPEWGSSSNGLRWDPNAESIEWITCPTTIPQGESEEFKFKVKENVLPNLRTMGMHLALELPKGVEISNVKVHDAIGTEFEYGNERVGALGFVRKAYGTDPEYCGYEMHPALSVKGDGQELGCTAFANRVLINIPFVNSYYENVDETVSFVLTNNGIQEKARILYGLVPRSYHWCRNRQELGYNLRTTNLEKLRHALLTEAYPFYYPAQLSHSFTLKSGEAPQPELPPTATVLVMDVSGSMGESWKGGVKIESAKQAALDFIEHVAREAQARPTDHRIGVVAFSGNAQVLLPLTGDYQQAREVIITLDPRMSTNLGDGLVKGLAELGRLKEEGQRFAILLSDGRSNTGMSRSQILSGPVAEAQRKGICIHTVGFGDLGDIDDDFLKRIALGSGCGDYLYAESPDVLFFRYVHARHTSLGDIVAEFSSENKDVTWVPGVPSALGIMLLNGTEEELHYTLAWTEEGKLQVQLRDPTGSVVDEQAPGVISYTGERFSYIMVPSPEPGVWTVEAVPIAGAPEASKFYAVASTRPGGAAISLPLPTFHIGDWTFTLPAGLPVWLLVAISVAWLLFCFYEQSR